MNSKLEYYNGIFVKSYQGLLKYMADKGYIDYSTIDFAPDSTPLEIERLINNDMVGQYREISQNLNSYCLGEITTPKQAYVNCL